MTSPDRSANIDPTSELPYLTADIAGIGGTLKREPEDFIVEEIPAYEPTGEGEHLFLWVEKRDVAADDLVRRVADALGILRDDVGIAGLKDRRAITRQYVSVPATCQEQIPSIDTEAIRVLRTARHGNKLRTGHLRGNRFEIVIRDVEQREGEAPAEPDRRVDAEHSSGSHGTSDNRHQKYAEGDVPVSICNGRVQTIEDGSAGASPSLTQIADAIRQQGFPNYYGEQRFGAGGETLLLGLDLLRAQRKPRDIPHWQRKFLLRLALSSVQSALFNEVLAGRLRDGLLQTVLDGDVMQKRQTGGLFVALDVAVEQQRFEAGETVTTGPMFGPKMRQATGSAAEREAEVLRQFDLSPAEFAGWKRLLPGTRRPLLAFASGLSIEQTDDSVRVMFALERGVYATTLLREFMKQPTSQIAADPPSSGD